MATGSRLTVRPLGDDEFDLAAALVAAAQPEHPYSADELRDFWRANVRMGRATKLALGEGDRTAGWAAVWSWEGSPLAEGRIAMFLPGFGVELQDEAWAVAEDTARGLEVGLAAASVWENHETTLEVLDRRGWKRVRRERFWRLELAGQDDRLRDLRAAARARAESAGYRIATAAELGGEAIYPELHQLDEETSDDIPRSVPRVPMPYEVWREFMVPPAVLPERVWIAVSGDRPAAISYLDYRSRPVATGYTGVRREARGAGLARALKLETLVQAIEQGVDAVETDNDSQNAPILHLNEELGYREIPGQVRLHKPLS